MVALLVGVALVVGFATLLYTAGPALLDAGVFGALPFTIACLGVVLGSAVVVRAAGDWQTDTEVTGPILRLRAFGDDEHRRCYVAVDDGESGTIRAFRVKWARYEGLEQGEIVTARTTRNLRCVRWIIPAERAPTAG